MARATFQPLRKGDRVAILASSSPIQPAMLEAGLAQVRELGFEPVTGAHVTDRWRFSAGRDPARLGDLQAALDDAAVRAIWLARGGHGLSPLLAGLQARSLQADPRPIIGESDATALGSWALRHGVGWVHGPMVASALREGEAGFDRASLLAALAGDAHECRPADVITLVGGEATGTMWGGCITLLSALCGTPHISAPRGSIAVLEDTGVKPYQVHRMLVQLRDAGMLEGLAGVVLGDFRDCVQHADQGYDIHEVLADFFRETSPGVPVSAGWPVGHAAAPHLSVPMGRQATLRFSGPASSLTFHAAS